MKDDIDDRPPLRFSWPSMGIEFLLVTHNIIIMT